MTEKHATIPLPDRARGGQEAGSPTIKNL